MDKRYDFYLLRYSFIYFYLFKSYECLESIQAVLDFEFVFVFGVKTLAKRPTKYSVLNFSNSSAYIMIKEYRELCQKEKLSIYQNLLQAISECNALTSANVFSNSQNMT